MPHPSPLKAEAARIGLTLVDVARLTGYTTGTIRNVSSGTVAPWPELRRRLAEVFGVDPFATVTARSDREPARPDVARPPAATVAGSSSRQRMSRNDAVGDDAA